MLNKILCLVFTVLLSWTPTHQIKAAIPDSTVRQVTSWLVVLDVLATPFSAVCTLTRVFSNNSIQNVAILLFALPALATPFWGLYLAYRHSQNLPAIHWTHNPRGWVHHFLDWFSNRQPH